MESCIPPPGRWARHPLHDPGRIWPETNCYVDLWIGVLHALGHDPTAMLGFTAAQDFEGDQFTFFKPPPEDLLALYGLRLQELALYDDLAGHIAVQLGRGRLVLVEVDGFHLPDTAGTTFGTRHEKTTIAVAGLDRAARRLDYVHNAGRFTLEGDGVDALFARPPGALFPYAEFVRCERPALDGAALTDAARTLLAGHLAARPRRNPVAAWRAVFPDHLAVLTERPLEAFHAYAFNILRQLGANAELLGSHVRWLGDDGLETAAAACDTLAQDAKTVQFQLARAVARRRPVDAAALFDRMERSYDTALATLAARCG